MLNIDINNDKINQEENNMASPKIRGDFAGKICVVTGAAGGMGQEITRAFLGQGARVAALDINQEECNAFVASLEAGPENVRAIQCDIASPESVISAHADVKKHFGACQILVNNAAILGKHPIEETDFDEWAKIVAVNLSGYFNCTKVFGEDMRVGGGGAIVHVDSIAASEPVGNAGAYSPSKAGVHMFSRQVACEWGPYGVRSNTISPGMIRTPFSEATYQQEGVEAFRVSKIPSRRIGTPIDIANTVLFLSSDLAGYINGADLLVDGGLSQTLMGQFPR